MSAFAAMNNSMTAAAFAAAGSHARRASMSAMILDAIILASIIIFGLVRLVSLGLNIALVGLILLAVLLVLVVVCSPEMRKHL